MTESIEYNYEVESTTLGDNTPIPSPYSPTDMNPYYCASLYRCTLPSQDEEASCNVYTSNLPLWADDDWLRQCFAPFGFIVSAKVMTDFQGAPKGYGFVQFTHTSEAQAAVQAMHGVWVDGRWMNVKLAHRDKNKGLRNQPSNNLYLCNLPKHYNFADVKHIFQGIPVSNMTILRDSNTKASRGVALVRLPTLQHAMMAIDVLNGILLPGHDRPLEVKYAESEEEKAIRKNDSNMMDHWSNEDCYLDNYEGKSNNIKNHIPTNRPIARIKIDKNKVDRPKTPPSPSCTVYIEDLGYDVDELYLYQLCSPFGAIESAKIDWSGDSGRVRFATPEEAASARENLDGKTVDETKIRARLIEDEPLQHARS